MRSINPVGGPFTHDRVSVGKTMSLVMLALLPATFFGFYLYGWPAIFLFSVTVLAALLAEAGSLYIAGKPVRPFLLDGSAILTGWLLAMTLPPWAPWWIGVVGAFLAIIVGKHVFGGIGQNLFNPAMVARVALLISFPLEMTLWISPQPLMATGSPGFFESLLITFSSSFQIDSVSSASVLSHIKTELSRDIPLEQTLDSTYGLLPSALGFTSGSLGETSSVLILAGGLFLLMKRIISWHIPFSMLMAMAVISTLFNWYDPSRYAGASIHLFSGATMLGAFFIATDLVTSPVTRLGQIIFGIGCGLLVYTIRTWAAYPEGMGFAVLLMNAVTPLIDHYIRPRIYGRDGKGKPVQYPENIGAEK